MKLTVDANVLFSALLKAGLTRRLIFDMRLSLYVPRSILAEYEKYAKELETRSKLGSKEFFELSKLVLSRVSVVPDEEIGPYIPAATHLCSDPKDIAYIACALAEGTVLWTRDRTLKHPRLEKWGTREIAQKLGLL